MRVANRPLAFILAAALLAVSVVVIVEVIGFAVHHSPLLVHWTTWSAWAGKTHWADFVIRFWAGVLIVVGLVLLALELRPSRVTRLPLESAGQATDAAVTRRGLARMLRAEAARVDGITGAAVQASAASARTLKCSASSTCAPTSNTSPGAASRPMA